MSTVTAAADTTLADGREVCVIRASELQVGDVMVKHGSVDLTVTGVQQYPHHSLVVAEYDCTAGSGARTLVASSFAFIAPRVEEQVH